jgi:hypothetical protein
MDMKSIGWMIEKERQYAEHGLIILDTCGKENSKLAHKLEKLIEKTLNIT